MGGEPAPHLRDCRSRARSASSHSAGTSSLVPARPEPLAHRPPARPARYTGAATGITGAVWKLDAVGSDEAAGIDGSRRDNGSIELRCDRRDHRGGRGCGPGWNDRRHEFRRKDRGWGRRIVHGSGGSRKLARRRGGPFQRMQELGRIRERTWEGRQARRGRQTGLRRSFVRGNWTILACDEDHEGQHRIHDRGGPPAAEKYNQRAPAHGIAPSTDIVRTFAARDRRRTGCCPEQFLARSGLWSLVLVFGGIPALRGRYSRRSPPEPDPENSGRNWKPC